MLFKKIRDFYLSRNMFIKLQASFLFIIITISAFNLLSNRIYANNIQKELIRISQKEISSLASKFDSYFESIHNKVFSDFYNKYKDIIVGRNIKIYDYKTMQDEISNYLLFDDYIHDFVLLTEKDEYLITGNGTYLKDLYFSRFYINPVYEQDFWLNQMKEEFSFKVYASGNYSNYISPNTKGTINLLPIAFKKKINSGYLIIALIDIDKLFKKLNTGFEHPFYLSENRTLLFTSSETDLTEIKTEGADPFKTENGYVISVRSAFSDMYYSTIVGNTFLKEHLNRNMLITNLMVILSLLLSIIISTIFVKYFNNPVKQIANAIDEKNPGTDMTRLKNKVCTILEENRSYQNDLSKKNSILKRLFFHAAINNNFVIEDKASGEILKNLLKQSKYALIYFKIHPGNLVAADKQNLVAASCELVKTYVSDEFTENVSFKVRNNTVVAVVSTGFAMTSVRPGIDNIMDKLNLENEYIYITTAYSGIYTDISQLQTIYSRLTEIVGHRSLTEETEIFYESEFNNPTDSYIFTLHAREQLKNLLSKAKFTETINLIENILMQNHKKHPVNKSFNLLFHEVLNCCKETVYAALDIVPEDLDFDIYLNQLEECSILKDYDILFTELISDCVKAIEHGISDSDYIIDYVKEYLEKHYSDEISFETIAENLKISRSYLSTYFKSKTNLNLSYYLSILRINKACLLLKETGLSVKDVGHSIGIDNTNTFIRLFKQLKGVTPNTYRREASSS